MRPSTGPTATARRARPAPARPSACASNGHAGPAYANRSSSSAPARAGAPSTNTPHSCTAAALEHGWTRNVLTHHIATDLHHRIGAAPSNFTAQLPAADSELAQQLTRDPYVLDFLDLTQAAAERDLENALVARLQAFLLELGHGFAFVGRQYHFEVDGDDFYIDLLFFNWAQSRFVVIELKIGRFQPEYTGKLGFYLAWVESNLRGKHRHSPTIGIGALRRAQRQRRPVQPRQHHRIPCRRRLHLRQPPRPHERDAVPTARQLTDLASRALTPPDNPST